MDFSSWYVMLVIGFASGVATCQLWDVGWCYLRDVFRQLHNGSKPNHPHSEGC